MAEVLLLIPAVFVFAGVYGASYAVLSWLDELIWRIFRRKRVSLSRLFSGTEAPAVLSERELYRLPRSIFPWMLVAFALGLAASWALMDGPIQVAGGAAGLIPLFWQRRRVATARQEIRRQVAEVIQEMRMHLAFGSSLAAALDALDTGDRQGIVYERLRFHRSSLTVSGPEAVLERLAEDLRSPELSMLGQRVRAARQGDMSYAAALQSAADDVMSEMHRQAEIEVEGAPLRLLFPMLVGLLPPILSLVLYPPAYGLISSLAGAGNAMP
jgi:Flp pilus assembly protein TadB